jgi:type IV pilus assembly protein PilW
MKTLRRQSGLTLVELMVATVLSLVLLAGVLLVFAANKATYQLQTGMGTLQENGRFAIRQIAADLQQAGFGGCQSPHLEPRVINVVSTSAAHLDAYVNGEMFDGENDPDAAVAYGGRNMLTGTDSIEIRGPLESQLFMVSAAVNKAGPITLPGTSTGLQTVDDLLISDCSSATTFRPSAIATGGGETALSVSGGLAQAYGEDAIVTRILRRTYFVADTGRTNASGQAVNALYRFEETGASGTDLVELVEGVDGMQIEYAFDTDGNGIVDAFDDADALAAGTYDWNQIMAVRVSLLLNSVEGASGSELPDPTFPADSGTTFDIATDDYRIRQEFSSLISIRNAVF